MAFYDGDETDGYRPRPPRVVLAAFLTSLITSVVVVFALRTLERRGMLEAVWGRDEHQVVPTVIGLQVDQARELLRARGLMLSLDEQRSDPRIPAGLIAGQTPLPGSTVDKGAQVRAAVSTGVSVVVVPVLAGLSRDDALRLLQTHQLVATKDTAAPSDTVAVGHVVSSTPAAGQKVAAGSAVELTVSSGPAGKAAPKLVGLGLTRAKKLIEAEGFKVGTVKARWSDRVDPGVVMEQEPADGARAPLGSLVNLVISQPDE